MVASNQIRVIFENNSYRQVFIDGFRRYCRSTLFGRKLRELHIQADPQNVFIVFDAVYEDIREELDFVWGEVTLDGCALPETKPDTIKVPAIKCNLVNTFKS